MRRRVSDRDASTSRGAAMPAIVAERNVTSDLAATPGVTEHAVEGRDMACRVLIVDDNDDMRYLTGAFLETEEGDIDLIGVARDGRQAVALVREHRPDVVLLDLVLE